MAGSGTETNQRKVFAVSELVRRVRVVMDENMTSESLLTEEDIETLSLDDLIEESLPRAAREVESNSAHYLLDQGEAFAGTIGWPNAVGKGWGVVTLPDDFLRLVTFKMSDWDYAVTDVIDESSVEYRMQKSRYSGIRGNPQRPVVAIVHRPVGLSLEFFACEAGAGVTLSRARYIPIPKIVEDGMKISEKLVDAVVYYTGYLTALSLGDNERAQNLLTTAKGLMV